MKRFTKVFDSAGNVQSPAADGSYTLKDATIYYFEFTDVIGKRSSVSIHWKYDATIVAAITIEASNRPEADVSSYAAVGSGWATTVATTINLAASAGETVGHYADFMAARMRAKVDVTTGGVVLPYEHAKGWV